MCSAISGIDQALLDIAGKDLGVPVYRLLGGPTRNRVRVYARPDLPRGDIFEQARLAREAGYNAYKIGFGQATDQTDAALIRLTANTVCRLREEHGDDLEIMVDNHGRFGVDSAIQLARALAPYQLRFLEEPIPPDNVDALVKVARAGSGVPIATGERLFTRWGFREVLEKQAAEVIQPDICHAGGISELRRIAALAEIYFVPVAPHNPQGPVSTAAAVHLAASIPNFSILEHCRRYPWFNDVQRDPLRIESGNVELPTKPGLGVELVEDVISTSPYKPLTPAQYYGPDGAVADV